MKKVIKILVFSVSAFVMSAVSIVVFAQSQEAVEYPAGYAVDMDLDGLTDEGENKLYKTDPENPDTDGDGYFDGVEVVNGTDPLDANSVINPEKIDDAGTELSWAWYFARATALVSFFLLYVVIFLGLTVRLPILNKIFSPLMSLRVHAWLSVQALIFATAHGIFLMFDKFLKFTLADVFIPFASVFETDLVALGTIGFYIMVLLILTSYFRNLISHKIWRISHFLNVVLYVIVIIHAIKLGTDLKNPGIGRNIFIWSNAALAFLFLLNLSYQLFVVIRRKISAYKIRKTQTR
ncbi:MAG: hypothetical protein ACD_15C00021G0001 [uncultured bacterium]|nr:MAG: hypothetical protein ACD_15C00021G0001 [uncultured bacterium]